MPMTQCGQCVFFDFQESAEAPGGTDIGRAVASAISVRVEPRIGMCRRHPPQVLALPGQSRVSGAPQVIRLAYLPPVQDIEGCGDGEARPPVLQ